MNDEIDQYLDRLLGELAGRTRDARRVVAEAEEHLRQAVDDGAAPAEAIARFGTARQVARRFEAPRLSLAPIVSALWRMGAIGLLAIGASGILSIGVRAGLGSQFMAGDAPGVTYTAGRCADLEEYHPSVIGCRAAAGAHHADEVETYRIAVGVLGAGALGGWTLLRRRRRPAWRAPIDDLTPAVGATLFGVAGVGLAAQGLSVLAQSTSAGPGQWLTGAVVSLMVAGAYGWQTLRILQVRTGSTPSSPSGEDAVPFGT